VKRISTEFNQRVGQLLEQGFNQIEAIKQAENEVE